MKHLYQLGAMARYEFILHRRRLTLVFLVILMALITLTMSAFVQSEALTNYFEKYRAENAESVSVAKTYVVALLMSFTLGFTMTFVLPLAFADAVPTDHHNHLAELWGSLPIQPATYLVGKILGAWLALLVVNGVMIAASSLYWFIILNEFLILPYVGMWLLIVGSLALLNTPLGIMLAASQPTRRRAFVLVAAAIFLPPIVIPILFNISLDLDSAPILWDYLNPLRLPIVLYYRTFEAPLGPVLNALAIGLLQVVVAFAGVLLYLRHKITIAQ